MSPSGTLLLIDGNNLFHRAYHALPLLTDKTGENANAVFGFSNMILKAVDEVKPTYIACAFDTKAPTFRHVEFEAYKAQRVAPPPDLYPQLPKVKAVLDAFGIRYFEMAGYEADDLLASLATQVLRKKTKAKRLKPNKKEALDVSHSAFSDIDEVIILSGDRDLLQLVNGDIKVQAPSFTKVSEGKPGWGVLFGAEEVKEKYGITPQQMVDWKALVGDPSDNVPGIAGIGPKTASELIQRYGSLENIYESLDEIGDKVREKLVAGRDSAVAAKKLIALDCSIDLGVNIGDLKYTQDYSKAIDVFEKLGFKSIVNKLAGVNSSQSIVDGKSEKKPVSSESKTDNNNQLELI